LHPLLGWFFHIIVYFSLTIRPRLSPNAEWLLINLESTMGVWEVMTLRDYLAGHVLRKAFLLFEETMGPWVKAEVKAHYYRKLEIAPGDDRMTAEHEALLRVRDVEIASLVARQDELAQRIRKCAKEERQAVAQERESVRSQLKMMYTAAPLPAPIPRWIEECRAHFSPRMRHHVNASIRWDTHMIVTVMLGCFRDAFARHLPESDLVDPEDMLRNIVTARSRRGHSIPMDESDVLNVLQQMGSVMKQCQCDPSAVAAVFVLLDEAKTLGQRARDESDVGFCVGPTLTADEANAQQLYTVLMRWEQYIATAMGLLEVGDGGALVDADRGQLGYNGGTVKILRALEHRWMAVPVEKSVEPQLCVIAEARNWYFHNLQHHCDFTRTFEAMRVTADAIAAATGHPPWQSMRVNVALTVQTPLLWFRQTADTNRQVMVEGSGLSGIATIRNPLGAQPQTLRAVCDLVLSRADSVPMQILRNKLMFTGEGRYGTAQRTTLLSLSCCGIANHFML
jgi:hypothetical protein